MTHFELQRSDVGGGAEGERLCQMRMLGSLTGVACWDSHSSTRCEFTQLEAVTPDSLTKTRHHGAGIAGSVVSLDFFTFLGRAAGSRAVCMNHPAVVFVVIVTVVDRVRVNPLAIKPNREISFCHHEMQRGLDADKRPC